MILDKVQVHDMPHVISEESICRRFFRCYLNFLFGKPS
jgi:hypothetical protein